MIDDMLEPGDSQRRQRLEMYSYKVETLQKVESGLHWVEVLGCLATTCTAIKSQVGVPAPGGKHGWQRPLRDGGRD